MREYALIFVCSGLGGMARYAMTKLVGTLEARGFPYGTLAVNLTGCLAIGVAATWLSASPAVRHEYWVALLVGFIGGYTTFSAFEWETLELLRTGHAVRAGLYVLLNVVVGLAAVWIGSILGERVSN